MTTAEVAIDPLASAFDAYRRGDAAGCVQQLDESRPQWAKRPDGWLVRGVAARALGKLTEAETSYRQAIALMPEYPEAWQNLGNLYAAVGRNDAALEAYGHALKGPARPPADRAALLVTMSGVAFNAGRIDVALAAVDEAIALAPDSGSAYNQCGKLLWEMGHTEAAVSAFQKSLASDPENPLLATNLLLVSQFSELVSEGDLSELARRAGQRIAARVPEGLAAGFVPSLPAPGERIRIGYLSSDFRVSAPGFFIRGILAGHDRSRFEVWALSDVRRQWGRRHGHHATPCGCMARRLDARHRGPREIPPRFPHSHARGSERVHRGPPPRCLCRALCAGPGVMAGLRRADAAPEHGRRLHRSARGARPASTTATPSAWCVCPSTSRATWRPTTHRPSPRRPRCATAMSPSAASTSWRSWGRQRSRHGPTCCTACRTPSS